MIEILKKLFNPNYGFKTHEEYCKKMEHTYDAKIYSLEKKIEQLISENINMFDRIITLEHAQDCQNSVNFETHNRVKKLEPKPKKKKNDKD